MDLDAAGLERLAQSIERVGAELARLIEEEHSAARTCDRPGTGGTRAAADEAHARRWCGASNGGCG
jgi:hypothetical protein